MMCVCRILIKLLTYLLTYVSSYRLIYRRMVTRDLFAVANNLCSSCCVQCHSAVTY